MGRRSRRNAVATARTPPSALPARAAAAGAFACLILVAVAARGDQPAPPGAESCTGCHAPAAHGTSIPAIDGRQAQELAAALHAFRSGERHATVMGRISKGFSPAELDAIAAWFAESRR